MIQPLHFNGAYARLAQALGIDPKGTTNIRLSFPVNGLARMTVHRTLTYDEIERLTTWCAEELDADGYQVIRDAHYSLVPKPREEA